MLYYFKLMMISYDAMRHSADMSFTIDLCQSKQIYKMGPPRWHSVAVWLWLNFMVLVDNKPIFTSLVEHHQYLATLWLVNGFESPSKYGSFIDES